MLPCERRAPMKLLLIPSLVLFVLGASIAHVAAAESFDERMKEVRKSIMAKQSDGKETYFGELEKQARLLLKEFPDKEEPYQMLIAVAANSEPDKGRAILKELDSENVPAEIKAEAKGLASKLDALGKPVDIKFTAIDGRAVDLAGMKGKVVLVDFWATWCGPCVAEIPNVVSTYNKLHDKGFEIIGISLDDDKAALEKFVQEKKMPWAQQFDGKGWKNAVAQKYGINSIPAMWLVDKKGNLRDMEARSGLAGKVEKMLAEN